MWRLFVIHNHLMYLLFARPRGARAPKFQARHLAMAAIVALIGWAAVPLAAQTPPPQATIAPPPDAADQALLDLREAFRRRNTKQFQALLPKVAGHPLEPLAAYWAMRQTLETATPSQIREHLSLWQGTYYEDRLRNDWLLLLGARQDWTQFLQEWPRYRMNDDRQVRCHGLHAQLVTQGRLSAAEVSDAAQLWLDQKEAEEACAPLVQRLLDQRSLDPQVVWQRARLGAEQNRPRIVSQAVGMLNPDWVASANTVQSQPDKYLDDKLTAVRHRTKELVTLALVRLAASQPELAAEHMARARWRTQLTQEEKSWVWGAIGRAAAQRLMPEAPDWFGKGQPTDMHAEHLTWWVRAALRTGRWEQVPKAIAAMPAALQQEPTWLYWHARALEQLKTPDASAQALAQYRQIASPHHFYGQLALEALGQAITPPPAPPPPTPAELQWARNHPGLQRALKAIAIGLRAEGVREWNYETNLHTPGGLPDRELLAAAHLACQQQVWDRCINTSKRTRALADSAQRYPTPHRDAVLRQTQAIGLDAAYVYGLIRQESRFITDARSHVGAAGLMQVMPATARWTAKKIGLTDFKPADIQQRDTNIAIGTGYLKLVLDDFEGSLPLAAAAYNAGPGRARRWRAPTDGQGPVLEGAIWAENIPFAETRDYVKRVLTNTTHYAALLTGQPQSLKARLGLVGPRSRTSPGENTELP